MSDNGIAIPCQDLNKWILFASDGVGICAFTMAAFRALSVAMKNPKNLPDQHIGKHCLRDLQGMLFSFFVLI